MQFKGITLVCLICSVIILPFFADASAVPTLSLSWYKNNGYGMGNDINGEWTVNTSTSLNVTNVEFYLDGHLEENDTSSPFSWHFDTTNYTEKTHTIKAVAYNSAGETTTVQAERNFVGFPITFVVEIIVFIVLVMVLSLVCALYRVRNKEDAQNHNQ